MARLIVSLLLLLIAVAGRAGSVRFYCDSLTMLSDSTATFAIAPEASAVALEVRVSFPAMREHSPRESLSIGWGEYVAEMAFGADFDAPHILLTVSHDGQTIIKERITGHVTFGRSDNSIAIEIDRTVGQATILMGSKELHEAASFAYEGDAGDFIALSARGCARFSTVVMETFTDDAAALVTEWTFSALEAYLDSRSLDPIEGRWDYLDRDNNERYAMPGGRYSLAVVKNADRTGYDIIYLGGAEVNAARWRPMMKKGELRPTIFSGSYELVWYDSRFIPLTADAYASLEQDALLSFSFPVYKSSLRFAKRPKDK